MAAKIDGMKPPFIPVGGLEGLPSKKTVAPSGGDLDFRKILLDKIADEQKVKFSAHAKTRLESRNIDLTEDNITQLGQALNRAQHKGAHDSLIVMQNLAFIANVDNRTIITAIDDNSLVENVFTNIDSAVFVK
jgi:flagellar operon protein